MKLLIFWKPVKILNDVKLYRRRFIPNEKILLHDQIIHVDNKVIITKWKTFHPKKNFSTGHSCVYIDEGFKVSKLFDDNNNFVSVYCDIINVKINHNEYIIEDLLVDITINNNSDVRVLDLDELADALDKNLITTDMAKDALRKSNHLLSIIYNGNFTKFINF